jgi:argininosuccinate synthase
MSKRVVLAYFGGLDTSIDFSSFTMGESYDQKDARGFIRILGLPARTRVRSLSKKEALK